jgi:hypothetical protein
MGTADSHRCTPIPPPDRRASAVPFDAHPVPAPAYLSSAQMRRIAASWLNPFGKVAVELA